jgi:hypothetical protein
MVAIILEREEQRRIVVGGKGPPSSGAVANRTNQGSEISWARADKPHRKRIRRTSP